MLRIFTDKVVFTQFKTIILNFTSSTQNLSNMVIFVKVIIQAWKKLQPRGPLLLNNANPEVHNFKDLLFDVFLHI